MVKVSLSSQKVSKSDTLMLRIRNHGFKTATLGPRYKIYHVHSNGSISMVDFPPDLAFDAILAHLGPLIGSYKEKVYILHLQPGDYLLETEFTINGLGKYTKRVYFTLK